MKVYDEDVEQCLYYIEQGESFTFVVDENSLCQFNDISDHDNFDIHITLTPYWYELTYCSNGWDKDTLKKELELFGEDAKVISDKYISSKFTFIWR